MIFAPFWSEKGYIFACFGLESDMIFEEITKGMYEQAPDLIVVSIPNE